MFANAQWANMVQGGKSDPVSDSEDEVNMAGVSAKMTVNGHVWTVVNCSV